MIAYEGKVKTEELLSAIKEERERLPQFGGFGEDNWADADEAIYVLEKVLREDYVDLQKVKTIDVGNGDSFMYDLGTWLESGDQKSDIYNSYCL